MQPSLITSRQNPRVKEAASLRNRKHRDLQGLTLVDGARECQRAAASGARLRTVFFCPEAGPGVDTLATELASAGGELVQLTAEVFDRLAYGDRLDGVICVVEAPARPLSELRLTTERPLIAVIEGVEKPGNLGALLRTADGAGVDAVIVADPVIDLYNPNVIRASIATVFKPNIAVATSTDTIAWLKEQHVAAFATRPDARQSCWDADLSGACAIVLGAESDGLSPAWDGPAVTPIALPMLGVGDSLNVSVTAAVLLYEARRQRVTSQ